MAPRCGLVQDRSVYLALLTPERPGPFTPGASHLPFIQPLPLSFLSVPLSIRPLSALCISRCPVTLIGLVRHTYSRTLSLTCVFMYAFLNTLSYTKIFSVARDSKEIQHIYSMHCNRNIFVHFSIEWTGQFIMSNTYVVSLYLKKKKTRFCCY